MSRARDDRRLSQVGSGRRACDREERGRATGAAIRGCSLRIPTSPRAARPLLTRPYMPNRSSALVAASAAWLGSFLVLLGGCSGGGASDDVVADQHEVVSAPSSDECRATTTAEVEACASCCGTTHAKVLEIIATTERCNEACTATGGVLCYAPCQQEAESACRATGGACESYFACVDGCTRFAP